MRRFIVPFFLVLVFGCARSEPPRVCVHGQVLLNGLPVRGGVIAFTPDKERSRQTTAARAMIYPDGRFLFTNGGRPVLAPGWYRVTVASLEMSGMPHRYREPDLSGLTCEVRPGQETEVTFRLEP